MKFEYADKENPLAFRYGATNHVGTYPLGAQFNWHGGMHVNENSYKAVKAIADGTIIAYRLNKEPLETNGIKFSASFVLIQHKYKSPKGRELTFYSLYNHLMPLNELKEFGYIPDIFKDYQYKVNGKQTYINTGVPAYPSIFKSFPRIIPTNTIVNLNNELGIFDNKPTHWAKTDGYTKVKFTDPDSGKVFDDQYVDLNDRHFEKINENMYRVKGHVANGKCWDYENMRSSPYYASDDNIVMQVPNGSIVLVEKKQGGYYKIRSLNGKKQEGYIYAESCKKGKFVLDFEEKNLDKIITGNGCNIPVKAGNIIGFTGTMGHLGQKEHRTTHLEVFTANDPSDFLKGKGGEEKDDTAETENFIKFEKGAMLSHQYPFKLKSGDEILVLQIEEEYSRIKLNKQFRTVEKADLGNGTSPSQDTANWTYTAFDLEKINETFDGTITQNSVIVLNEAPSQIEQGQTTRNVCYTLPDGQHCYWVHKNNLPTDVNTTGQYVTLDTDVDGLFENKPNKNHMPEFFPNDSEKETELLGDHFVGKKEAEEIKYANETWYKIKIQDYRGERSGFIKSNAPKVSKVSAYDWTVFGFKVLKDQPDNFIFDATEKNAPQFLKSVFKEMDTDGNKKLSPQELRKGLNNMYICQRLSKLVCYHRSEWGVEYGSLKQEIETLLNKGIEQEEDGEIKKELEKQKEQSLQVINDKVNALDFWGRVKVPGKEIPADMTYVAASNKYRKMHPWETVQVLHPDDENHGLEKFPKDTKVYHFHPNAFIEQMKRVNSCYCDRDLTVEEVKNIVKTLRDSENGTKNDYKLFSVNSDIPNSDKTYIKFAEALNEIFDKYNINSCIRKIHFLSQVYHETNRFRSSKEEGELEYLMTKDYYPFYGRGLMQLTWKGNVGSGHVGYKQYFDFLERTDYLTNYDEINSNIDLAFDSAGWFWEKGKTLSNSNPGVWNAPSFAGTVGSAVALEQAFAVKTILTYGTNNTEYGVLNLNLLADNDWGDTISWLVNGGGNGFQERRNYLKKLKTIFCYENCINNK